MKRILIILILAAPIATYSQSVETFTREVENFTKIKASNGVKVNLVNGTPGTIKVNSRRVDKEDIIIEVHGNTLRLSIDAWSQLREHHHNWEVEIDVPIRSLSSITCVTGAMVTTEAPLRGDKMKITSNTGGELFLDLNYGEVVATISTGAVAKLKGSAELLEITSSMGAEVEANRLEADYVYAKAGMGAVLEVYAKKEITSSASFGGEIEVLGNPDRTHTKRSMGGEIKGIRD